MESIVFLAALVPLWMVTRSGPGHAFLYAYLPSLLLLPGTYHTTLSGIPKVSFNDIVIVTILPFALSRYKDQWRLRPMDLLVFALVAVMAVSEFQAAGYKEAQNLTFGMISAAAAPYLVARLVIPAENLHVATARQFVILMFGMSIIALYEFRFGINLFLTTLKPFFPGQGDGWVTTFRHGFARVAGPFAHCILAGMIAIIGYRLQRWLEWGGHWEPHFKMLPNFPISKTRILTVMLVVFSISTMARGPWIGGAIGAILVLVGRSKKRSVMATGALVAAILILPPAYIGFQSYMDVKPGEVMTMSQETAIYRKVLMEKYSDIAAQHMGLGWGRNTWPKVAGMASIDNYFLLLTLMHGAIATGLFILLFVWSSTRLIWTGMHEPIGTNSLAFAFAGMQIAVLVSLATVYLGEQATPVMFMIFGWAESHLAKPYQAGGQVAAPAAHPLHSFRVIH